MSGTGWPITCIHLIREGIYRSSAALEPADNDEIASMNESTGAAKHLPYGGPCSKQVSAYATSKIISISTAMPKGRACIPTAERACRPESPKSCTRRSEAPLITLG